ncbi:rhodanese domain-containing protein CG4456-like isoform X2 [Oratosquilla oratoria]|uniref:rhodanese domain-containing protein CG4456-like isoform X2 n=1 Tax=Oratosquilla oratoria TaxID=337810 RepID=UPI003F766E2B
MAWYLPDKGEEALGVRCVSVALQSTLCGRLIYRPNQNITPRNLSHSNLLPDIEYEELLEKLKNDQVKLIDVRMKDEIAELGCAAGSLSLPLPYLGDYLVLEPEHFLMTLGFPKPSEKDTIVTMCKAGSRARTAQLAFMGARYTNVRTYKGSFQDWTEKGGPMKQTQ